VPAFSEARGKDLDAVVEALDVIEAATLPPREPVVGAAALVVLLARERRGGSW
jgi:hypothetical protein